jgi:(E)-4-hydroxy-3-methylbut-2-enyl-diphosphate synthase
MKLAQEVADFVLPYKRKAKVAVMGCVVNGPGEAKDADLGIAGGNGYCLLFKKGEPYLKVAAHEARETFLAALKELLENGQNV